MKIQQRYIDSLCGQESSMILWMNVWYVKNVLRIDFGDLLIMSVLIREVALAFTTGGGLAADVVSNFPLLFSSWPHKWIMLLQ